jgi:chromosome segregation ATPase
MCGIVKKSLIGAGLLAGILGLTFGRESLSYFYTGFHSARASIRKTVPVEFEIQRARDMISNLMPEIRKHLHVIAEEEVNVEHLAREVANFEGSLEKQKRDLLALNNAVGSDATIVKRMGRKATADEVKRELAQRFDRYKTADETLASKKKILAAREKSLMAARHKLEQMLSARKDLEVQIENLDARLKMMQAEQTAVATVEIDNSAVVRAQKLIGELNKQLDVQERMLAAEGKLADLTELTVEKPVVSENISSEINEYFSGKPAEAAVETTAAATPSDA